MAEPRYPSLYQVNTRVWLTNLSRELGRSATLDDIPDAEIDRWAAQGFDWIWLLSVWTTGFEAQKISRSNADWRHEFEETLFDLQEEDIAGSGFAVTAYAVHPNLGGDAALVRLRERMRSRGLRLMLDFVPNHMGLGHPWVEANPEHFIQGTDLDLDRAPQNYVQVKRKNGDIVFAHGRDPYFPGWPDTLQINYGNPATQEAMIGELERIATRCDGVRCDMAMLVLPEVFERTWGVRTEPFWPKATDRVRKQSPAFCFMAEVYWDLEWKLQHQGFDYAYDKRLYDRLREEEAKPVREHFWAGLDYQDKLARFLENHDEPRAAAVLPTEIHQAAAVITFLSPGLRFFHQGEFAGCRVRISPHLVRGPDESCDPKITEFYDHLLAVLRNDVVRNGNWQLVDCLPAWEGNGSNDAFVAFAWQHPDCKPLFAIVNYSDHTSQCRAPLPMANLAGRSWRLQNLLSNEAYDRSGDELQGPGMYLELAPWQAQVFELSPIES